MMNWRKNLSGKVSCNEPLSRHTTLGIGGEAKLFIQPKDIRDLESVLLFLKRERIPVLIIGAGSNILAKDSRLNKAVIKLDAPYFKRVVICGNYIEAGAGIALNKIVSLATLASLSGAEFLAGIPGNLGGALLMNAGAWGNSIEDLVDNVSIMDYNGKIEVLSKKEIHFAYRSSSLKSCIVLKAVLKFKKAKKASISRKVDSFLKQRRREQDLTRPSAGCVFKNPPGKSAGKLIDACGLKGRRAGGAGISNKHANFILNQGNAQARDVLKLMALAKREVRKRSGIILEPEIKIWQ